MLDNLKLLALSLKENMRYKARSQNGWIADRQFAVWLPRTLTSAILKVSDIHIVNCIATLMSARFPQDVTDMILPLDQSMQNIQHKKYTSARSDLSYRNFFVHLGISETKMNLL